VRKKRQELKEVIPKDQDYKLRNMKHVTQNNEKRSGALHHRMTKEK